MVPIGGRPLLEHQIELAKDHGVDQVLMFVCHGAERIQEHFGDGRAFGLSIEYVIEREPLGTAGAVLAGLDKLADRFLVMYGDTMVHVDLERLWRAHAESGPGWDATLLVHPNDHPRDSDLVEADEQGRIVAFHHRPHAPNVWRRNLVNAALYVLERKALEPFTVAAGVSPCGEEASGLGFPKTGGETPPQPAGGRTVATVCDFGKDLFPRMLERGQRLQAYNSPEYIKDIGTPARYDRVCAEFESGVIQRSSLAVPQKAVFLDRDGTLVVEKDCLRSADELELLPGAGEAVRLLNHHGWRVVVVTNQPVVAKGWASEEEVRRMHHKMEMLLGDEHAFVDRIYYCPHHPEKGFAGERPELKMACDCRKPGIGMVEQGRQALHIDLSQSWLIGDSTTDMRTARKAGLRSILVATGHGGRDGKYDAAPEFTCENLLDAVRLLLKNSPL